MPGPSLADAVSQPAPVLLLPPRLTAFPSSWLRSALQVPGGYFPHSLGAELTHPPAMGDSCCTFFILFESQTISGISGFVFWKYLWRGGGTFYKKYKATSTSPGTNVRSFLLVCSRNVVGTLLGKEVPLLCSIGAVPWVPSAAGGTPPVCLALLRACCRGRRAGSRAAARPCGCGGSGGARRGCGCSPSSSG